jgi:hypothetical protein
MATCVSTTMIRQAEHDRRPLESGVDRRHHASRDLTKPHIGLEILPFTVFGFPLRHRVMRLSTVVWSTFKHSGNSPNAEPLLS